MRVTSVELRADGTSDVIELSYLDPRSVNPFRVVSIAPLDADQIVPQFYGTGGGSGMRFYNMVLAKREPVVLIDLNPRYGEPTNASYSELRDRLYRLIQSSRTGLVKIVFLADDVDVAAITGRVNKAETAHFTEKPQFQITFTCPDPMLKSPLRVPVEHEVDGMSIVMTDSVSTAAHGFRFDMEFNAAASNLIIDDESGEWEFKITPHGGFELGDHLIFSSEYKAKELYIQRGSSKIYLADTVGSGSMWPILFCGENQFNVNRNVSWDSITHFLTYWGV
jgi:hypothetical protein